MRRVCRPGLVVFVAVACGSTSSDVTDAGPSNIDAGSGADAAIQPSADYVFDETVIRTYALTIAATATGRGPVPALEPTCR